MLRCQLHQFSKQCIRSFGNRPIFVAGAKMSKTPPQIFGQFKQLPSQYFEHLKCILEKELPQSRRTLETLKLTMKGHVTLATFYIPKLEEPAKMSGMVLVIPQYYQSRAISHFSKQEDVEAIHELIDQSVDWTTNLIFSGVAERHIPSLMNLCQKRCQKVRFEDCPLWENNTGVWEINPDQIITESNWKVKPLTSEKYAKLIDGNWKFRDETSLRWIKSQCENGMAFGAFPSGNDVNEPVSWIVAYK